MSKMCDMRCMVTGLLCGVVALVAAGPTYAQSDGEGAPSAAAGENDRGDFLRKFLGRLSMHVNGSYQAASTLYETRSGFPVYGEEALFSTRQEFDGGAHIDVGGSLRVWRELAVGASYTELSTRGVAMTTGTIPHPLEFGLARTVPLQAFVLPHRQRATHVHVSWRLALRDTLDVTFSAGPTYFNLRQGIITSVTARELDGPFADINARVGAAERTRNGLGFNVGADLTWMLTRQLGVGYFTRFTLGSLDAEPAPFSPEVYHVGGIQNGLGLRVRF